MDQSDSQPHYEFVSPTYGQLSADGMFSKIAEYASEDLSQKYNLIIGTDSFLSTETVFVSAVIIHRVGHGGRYFYRKTRRRKIENIRQRIFYEATMSIELASLIVSRINGDRLNLKHLPVEIHLDVGHNGDTKDIVREVVGMVNGSGYAAVTKPDSYGATKVADRHSK